LKKKIFIITGESSGDKLASNIVSHFDKKKFNINAIGSDHLKKNNIKLLFDNKQISVMGFVDVLKKIFYLIKKINQTVFFIKKFKPNVILSIDSPDFAFRVEDKIKKMLPEIKIVHFVAPSIWAWRERRVYYFRKFIDHIILLFPFEVKIFNRYNLKNTFVGHPFFEKKTIYKKLRLFDKKKIISICPGSRISEIKCLMPIIVNVINKIIKTYGLNFVFHFPVLPVHKKLIKSYLVNNINYLITTDENQKNFYIKNSILSVAKSGTISLDICKNSSPLITIYKTSFLNYILIKPLVKVKFGNILNIIANKEIIPELIQQDCTPENIFTIISKFLSNKRLRDLNVSNYKKIINKISKKNTSRLVADIVKSYC